MTDLNDAATTELTPNPKKRGRPATGKAKTPAQRQSAYRIRKESGGEHDQRNLNIWIKSSSISALARLAKNEKITRVEMLEKLISKADEKCAKKAAESGKWDEYWG
jgi:hypothetical protein